MEVCEFCGRKVKKTEGTSFTGLYCQACFRLCIAECREAIRLIQGKPPTKRMIMNAEKEKKLKEAFDNLVNREAIDG